MPRAVKYYEPEERRYFEDNCQCLYCGNTTAFFIDVRLRHMVSVTPAGLAVSIDQRIAGRVTTGLEKNALKLIERASYLDHPVIRCANCQDGIVDNQWQLLEYCWQMGCPGCEVCGEYIAQEDLRDLCFDCLRKNDGNISEDDCATICEHAEFGLGQVRAHYNVTLDEFKQELGY